jgi:Ankyrin repeat
VLHAKFTEASSCPALAGDAQFERTALLEAAENGHVDIVKMLVEEYDALTDKADVVRHHMCCHCGLLPVESHA